MPTDKYIKNKKSLDVYPKTKPKNFQQELLANLDIFSNDNHIADIRELRQIWRRILEEGLDENNLPELSGFMNRIEWNLRDHNKQLKFIDRLAKKHTYCAEGCQYCYQYFNICLRKIVT